MLTGRDTQVPLPPREEKDVAGLILALELWQEKQAWWQSLMKRCFTPHLAQPLSRGVNKLSQRKRVFHLFC